MKPKQVTPGRLVLGLLSLVLTVAGCTTPAPTQPQNTPTRGAPAATPQPQPTGSAPISPVSPVQPTGIPSSMQESPYVRGAITTLKPGGNPNALDVITVEGTRDADTQVDKAVATITGQTTIYEQQDQGKRQVDFSALKPGQRVEVWFDGPMLLSYPPQGGASQIVILASAGDLPATVQPTAQPPAGNAAGTPPAAPSAATWTRQQFGTAWEVAYPQGWQVNDAGAHEGAIQLIGPYEGHVYRVDLSYPIGLSATTLEDWVAEQLATLTPDQRAATVASDVTFGGIPARRVLNVPVAGSQEPTHLVYIWRTADKNPRLISVTQTDSEPFDSVAAAAFLDRFLAEQAAPSGG